MRRVLFSLWIMSMIIAFTGTASAQGNPRGTAKLTVEGKAITVEYGRPSLKGRTAQQLLEKVPAGGVWRLGADKSTTLATAADLVFGDVTVPKGEYSLWARKESDGSWKLVINKQHGQWGTEHDAAQDLAAAPLAETKADKSAEQVTISLEKRAGQLETIEAGGMKLTGMTKEGGVLTIAWGETVLIASFKAK